MDREAFPPSEIRHLESLIASMRVNELQTVLSMFKMPKLGKKQELIQRCTDLLRTPALQIQVANQVKILVGKNNTRAAPYSVPIRAQATRHSERMVLRGKPDYNPTNALPTLDPWNCLPNGLMMNGNSGYGYRHGTNAQLLHQMQSNALHQQARVLRNLVPIPLPFYDWHKTVLEPMELPPIMSGVKTPCKQTFTFLLPREYFLNWSSNNTPLPRYEMQLRFFQVPENYASQELPDDFPLNCVARVEEQHVNLPALIPTNKPNVEPKRPSRPVDITQYCLNVRDYSRPMRLMVEWTGDKRTWAVAIYLVYRVTSEILRDRATGAAKSSDGSNERPNHRQEESVTRNLIRARLGGGNDDEIAMDQLKISLLCPLSRTRINLPARCKLCHHLQCFDLYNYLQMNERRPTWRCPVCSGPAHFKNIIIDEYFQNMLASVDAETTEVELLVDGSYKTVENDVVDLDDEDAPTATGAGDTAASSGTGTPSTSAPPPSAHHRPKSHEEEVIVLSDSDDEDKAVEQAIRNSIAESERAAAPAPKPASPTPRSRDSSIIIIDDESPPRPQQVQNKISNGSSSSTSTLSPPSTSAGTLPSPIMCSSPISTNGVMAASRLAAPPLHSVLAGHQNLYNSTAPLSYYHQSQWSQAASRPQYPTSQTQTSTALNAGSAFTLSYKAQPPPPMSTLLGRYNPTASALPFGCPNPTQPNQTSHFSGGANLQQVLASLVQQSAFANGTGSPGSTNSSQ